MQLKTSVNPTGSINRTYLELGQLHFHSPPTLYRPNRGVCITRQNAQMRHHVAHHLVKYPYPDSGESRQGYKAIRAKTEDRYRNGTKCAAFYFPDLDTRTPSILFPGINRNERWQDRRGISANFSPGKHQRCGVGWGKPGTSCHDVRSCHGPIRIKLMNITTKFRFIATTNRSSTLATRRRIEADLK